MNEELVEKVVEKLDIPIEVVEYRVLFAFGGKYISSVLPYRKALREVPR